MPLDSTGWLLNAAGLIPGPPGAWSLFTRLGEAQILLPAMVAALLWLVRTPRGRPLAAAWLTAVCAATLITTLSKVAFIGWEIGYAPLDYTGLSGHAMFAAAVLPVLARVAAGRAPRPWPRGAILLGYALALMVAVSRVKTGAHSVADIVPGFALGALASAMALKGTRAPEAPTPHWVGAALVAWLVALPFGAPASRTHDWVTQLSMQLSGRAAPYTRREMQQDFRRAQAQRRGTAWSLNGPPVGLPAGEVQLQPGLQGQIGGHGIR